MTALKGGTVIAQATVMATGEWDMNLPAGGSAGVRNGDMISFAVNGKAAAETIRLTSGQFVPVPGLKLTVGAATTTPTAVPVVIPGATKPGALVSMPNFNAMSGQASAVFTGGSVDDLMKVAIGVQATGVWAQDANGNFQLLVLGGPAFLTDQFRAKFGSGFSGLISVTLTK